MHMHSYLFSEITTDCKRSILRFVNNQNGVTSITTQLTCKTIQTISCYLHLKKAARILCLLV